MMLQQRNRDNSREREKEREEGKLRATIYFFLEILFHKELTDIIEIERI